MIRIEEFKNSDLKDVKYRLNIPKEVDGIESIISFMKILTKSRNQVWDCLSIKNYIIKLYKKQYKYTIKMLYFDSILEWNVEYFTSFPLELQEWLQPFKKEYDSDTKIMKVNLSEEELFYLKLKYEDYLIENVSNKIIVEEI